MGYGDLQGLMEKIKEMESIEEIDAEEIMKGNFTLETFYQQLKATKKMSKCCCWLFDFGFDFGLWDKRFFYFWKRPKAKKVKSVFKILPRQEFQQHNSIHMCGIPNSRLECDT